MVRYTNGNYRVYLINDGTKIRVSSDNTLMPTRPESIDCSITEKCCIGCKFCYANCTPNGKHAILFDIEGEPVKWLKSIPAYTELAINGNDMDHPDLIKFLTFCKYNQIIVNITVHMNQFINNYDLLKHLSAADLIKGIGVSVNNLKNDKIIDMLKGIPNVVCHVIAGIVDDTTLQILGNNNLKLLILGYKNKGRGLLTNNDDFSKTVLYIKELSDRIDQYIDMFNCITFDCLAVKQLEMKDKLSEDEWNKLYMGDDGTSTFYIDAVNNKFSQSSTSTIYYGINDDYSTIEDMFKHVQKCFDYKR